MITEKEILQNSTRFFTTYDQVYDFSTTPGYFLKAQKQLRES